MRTIVFFDLPNVYSKDKRNYQLFRKFLIRQGFVMMQESVYSKIVLNSQQSSLLIDRIKKQAPKRGLIQALIVTEKQYSQMKYIIGRNTSKIIDNEDRIIILWELKLIF